MVLMVSRSFSSPSAIILSGVSATGNNSRVALLTPASVACADSTTATRSVKGLRCSNSPRGSGLAFWKRSNASRTSAGVQDLKDLGFGALGLRAFDFFAGRAADFAPDLAFAFAAFFGGVRTEAVLTR